MMWFLVFWALGVVVNTWIVIRYDPSREDLGSLYAVFGVFLWPIICGVLFSDRHFRRRIFNGFKNDWPPNRRRECLETDYQECLRLIGYQPKPESYWQLKEIEWEAEV